jgi:hypothetical protein
LIRALADALGKDKALLADYPGEHRQELEELQQLHR